MQASNQNVGDRFMHTHCGIIEIVEESGTKCFRNDSGDLFSHIDDDFIMYQVDKNVVCHRKVEVDERVLNCLLAISNTDLTTISNHFKKIDERMAKVQIGMKLTCSSGYDFHSVYVLEIEDRANGVLRIQEPGIKSWMPIDKVRLESVTSLWFPDEELPMLI